MATYEVEVEWTFTKTITVDALDWEAAEREAAADVADNFQEYLDEAPPAAEDFKTDSWITGDGDDLAA